MEATKELSIIRGFGIEDDVNASSISPRQILITRKEDLDDLLIPYGGLRENMIVEGITEKDFLPGSRIIINEGIEIRLTFYCEPCKRIAGVVPGMNAMRFRRGILGVIIKGGIAKSNDTISCLPKQFEPLPEKPYERFLHFMKLVPRSKIVTYKMVSCGMGGGDSYIRAIPIYIEKAKKDFPDLPLHRIVNESGRAILKQVPKQVSLLAEEGVVMANDILTGSATIVNFKQFKWDHESIYLD